MTDHEKNEILNEHEMSPEEMKTLSGGVTIDWDAKCHATVRNGASCWGTDACYGVNVHYRRDKKVHGCSATVETTSFMCSSSDYCSLVVIRYANCSKDYAV